MVSQLRLRRVGFVAAADRRLIISVIIMMWSSHELGFSVSQSPVAFQDFTSFAATEIYGMLLRIVCY